MGHYGLYIYATPFFILFLGFGYLFRKRISYIFCPLEKYKGGRSVPGNYYGKRGYIGLMHAILSFGICMACFSLLYAIPGAKEDFQNNIIRISTFLLLWLLCLFITGLLIEWFLVSTDEDYKRWKHGYINNAD